MIRVVWSHPAVLDGAERTSDLIGLPDGVTIEECIARAFLPYGIEGIDYLTIHSVRS